MVINDGNFNDILDRESSKWNKEPQSIIEIIVIEYLCSLKKIMYLNWINYGNICGFCFNLPSFPSLNYLLEGTSWFFIPCSKQAVLTFKTKSIFMLLETDRKKWSRAGSIAYRWWVHLLDTGTDQYRYEVRLNTFPLHLAFHCNFLNPPFRPLKLRRRHIFLFDF